MKICERQAISNPSTSSNLTDNISNLNSLLNALKLKTSRNQFSTVSLSLPTNQCTMAKGPEKNTKNKALHTKLLSRKKAKLQEAKNEKAARLKALVTKMNQQVIKDTLDHPSTPLED